MRVVYRAKDILEAHIVAGMLQASGIECYVGGHFLQGGVGDLAPFDFATVSVKEEDLALAKARIQDYEAVEEELAARPSDSFEA